MLFRRKAPTPVGRLGWALYLLWVVAGTAIAFPALLIIWAVMFGVPLAGTRLFSEIGSTISGQ